VERSVGLANTEMVRSFSSLKFKVGSRDLGTVWRNYKLIVVDG
jgi:hypothetical protein